MQLRGTRPGFAEQLAGVLEPVTGPLRLSVLSPADAVQPMRRILARYGLETAQALRQADGSMRPTWYEAPELWIARWTNSESVIVLKEDADGPADLGFFRRLAVDTIETVYRIGNADGEATLLGAFWDLGIRVRRAQFHTVRTPAKYISAIEARYQAMPGCTLTLTEQPDGWIDYRLTMTERPHAQGERQR